MGVLSHISVRFFASSPIPSRPKENIPEFLGGESPAIIGPSDPLWADVDAAVRSWASGGDPFLDRADVDRVSGRIRRERKRSLQARSIAESKSRARAESKAGERLLGEETEKSRLLPAAELERAPGVASAAELDGEDRKARVRASRRAVSGSGGRRSKSRKQLPDGSAETKKGVREGEEKGRKKKHRRQRGETVSSATTAGRPSSSASRRRTTSPPPLRPTATKTTTASAAPPGDAGKAAPSAAARAKGSSERGSILRGSSVRETVGSRSRGRGGKKGRGRSLKDRRKKSVTWEDEGVQAAETEDGDDEEVAAEGDDGAVGERVLDGFARGVMPLLHAWFSQLVAGLLAVGRVLLSTAESVFRFLRDAFFEQVEVED